MPWADMPGQPPNPAAKDRLMHAVLHIGGHGAAAEAVRRLSKPASLLLGAGA